LTAKCGAATATNSGANNRTSRAAHGIANGCTCTAAYSTTNHSTGFTFTLFSGDSRTRCAAHGATDNSASAAANRITQRSATGTTQSAAKTAFEIAIGQGCARYQY
jgi:hypothetical protein